MKNRIVRFINAIFPIDDEQESSRIYDNSTIMEEMYKSDGKYYEIRNEWKRVYFFCNIVIGVGHSLKGCFRILWILNNFNNIDRMYYDSWSLNLRVYL